ncbi:MAG: 5'-nucleotidase C-terminal domain-containing protein, partial [Pseudomonadota bacterium]
YDAITLGNHDFDYGLGFLRDALAKAAFPVVSANVSCLDGGALAAPFAILDRDIHCDDGLTRAIKIGIIGFAPPQIADWDDATSSRGVTVDDIITTADVTVPQMKAAGADVIIALCHSGIGAEDQLPRMENAAVPLAKVEGIDILLLGHTHEAHPDTTLAQAMGAVDYAAGQIHRKPAVMATFYGKSLGIVDLELRLQDDCWQIADQRCALLPAKKPQQDSPLRQQLRSLVSAPHTATLTKMRAPIAQTDLPITSYFATIQPDLSRQLLGQAMQRIVADALEATAQAEQPLLAAVSPFRFGGRSGLGHYIDIPPGPVTLRDAAAIFPFADGLCAVKRTGAQLRLWLERAAAHYNQIQPGQYDQPLINPLSAGYNCDTIHGLHYQIDLTQPARFNVHGVEIDPDARRIRDLRYLGQRVADTDVFVVATNSFRAKGGGGFPEIAPEDLILTTAQPLRAHLIDDLRALGRIETPVEATWGFAAIPETAARFASAPAARNHLCGPIKHIGPAQDGFETYQISF